MRGRVQVEWRCPNQTRANTQRDWLAAQLTGRGFVGPAPRAAFEGRLGMFVTRADIAFDTTQEGDTVKTLCLTRMSADSFIQAGSSVQFHECPHDDGLNTCLVTLVRTVK